MKREHGFTLIELMVIVLIVAILLAIAIPTFIGIRDRKVPVRGGIVVKKHFEPEHSETRMTGKISTVHTVPDEWTVLVTNCVDFDPCKQKEFEVDKSIFDAVELGQWYGKGASE